MKGNFKKNNITNNFYIDIKIKIWYYVKKYYYKEVIFKCIEFLMMIVLN